MRVALELAQGNLKAVSASSGDRGHHQEQGQWPLRVIHGSSRSRCGGVYTVKLGPHCIWNDLAPLQVMRWRWPGPRSSAIGPVPLGTCNLGNPVGSASKAGTPLHQETSVSSIHSRTGGTWERELPRRPRRPLVMGAHAFDRPATPDASRRGDHEATPTGICSCRAARWPAVWRSELYLRDQSDGPHPHLVPNTTLMRHSSLIKNEIFKAKSTSLLVYLHPPGYTS